MSPNQMLRQPQQASDGPRWNRPILTLAFGLAVFAQSFVPLAAEAQFRRLPQEFYRPGSIRQISVSLKPDLVAEILHTGTPRGEKGRACRAAEKEYCWIPVVAEVENVGLATAGRFYVGFHIDGGPGSAAAQSPTESRYFAVSGLAPREKALVIAHVGAFTYFTGQSLDLSAVADIRTSVEFDDPEEAASYRHHVFVDESKEGNNESRPARVTLY